MCYCFFMYAYNHEQVLVILWLLWQGKPKYSYLGAVICSNLIVKTNTQVYLNLTSNKTPLLDRAFGLPVTFEQLHILDHARAGAWHQLCFGPEEVEKLFRRALDFCLKVHACNLSHSIRLLETNYVGKDLEIGWRKNTKEYLAPQPYIEVRKIGEQF